MGIIHDSISIIKFNIAKPFGFGKQHPNNELSTVGEWCTSKLFIQFM